MNIKLMELVRGREFRSFIPKIVMLGLAMAADDQGHLDDPFKNFSENFQLSEHVSRRLILDLKRDGLITVDFYSKRTPPGISAYKINAQKLASLPLTTAEEFGNNYWPALGACYDN